MMGLSILSTVSEPLFAQTLQKAQQATDAELTHCDSPIQFQNSLTTQRFDLVFFDELNPELTGIICEILNSPLPLEDQPLFILVQANPHSLDDFFESHLETTLPLDCSVAQIRLVLNMAARIRALKEAYLLTLELMDLSQQKLSEAEESWVETRQELESIAHHDALTGLYNRKYMELSLKDAVLSAKKNQYFLSVMMLDIDHFKAINDTYGHQVGDEVLKRVARTLQSGIRKSDVVARYGGEEMLGILAGTAAKDALLIAEKTRQKIADIQFFAVPIQKKGDDVSYMLIEVQADTDVRCLLFPQVDSDPNAGIESQWAENIWLKKIQADLTAHHQNPGTPHALPLTPITITASFGISTYPDDFTLSSKGNALLESTSEEDLMIYMADKALYKAKKSGRNRTLTYYGIQCAGDESIPIFRTADQLMMQLRAKDTGTFLHSLRVGLMAYRLAKALNWTDSDSEIAKWSGVLHDIGKAQISTAILLKPSALTPTEYASIKTHPQLGVDMAKEYKNLTAVLPGILSHHERWNGSGYPTGLRQTEITPVARILGIVDTFDAMTGSRPYRLTKDTDIDSALTEIQTTSGTLYDPDMVHVFLSISNLIIPIIGMDEKTLRYELNYPF